jgi:N-acetylglucosaminyldiphosphoundecaprenol N-acetyl-beta-D-mannosaminyltransferase
MNILGVKVDNLSKEEIVGKISGFLSENKFHQIATVNQEFILTAQKDNEFRNILNNCDLNIADSIGIKFAFWRFGEKLKRRMAGVDLMQEILKIANEKKLKIYLAANSGGLSGWEETRDAIKRKYPELEIKGENISCHSWLDQESRGISNQVQDGKDADIIFANFGAPYQEKFLNLIKSDKIKLAVGVGGSFDYLTGQLKRAPKWMQFFGVEWFWRLLLQPKRIKRIWNAAVVFPIELILK